MTTEKAIDVLRGMELYLCSGNPIWKTDLIKEAVNVACEVLRRADTPQTKSCFYCNHYEPEGWCNLFEDTVSPNYKCCSEFAEIKPYEYEIKALHKEHQEPYCEVADTPQTENPCDGCVCDDGKHLMYCMNCKGIAWKTEPPKVADTPQREQYYYDERDFAFKPCDTPQMEERPAGCSKDWSASCTSCERYFSCDYLSGRKTDCGQGEPNE